MLAKIQRPSLNKDIVLLQKNYAWLEPDNLSNNLALASTVQANLMNYRYSLSYEAFDALQRCSFDRIVEFNHNVMTYLEDVTGGKHDYRSFYPNFPEEVMSLSDAQLIENALRHEFNDGAWSPNTPILSKPIAFEHVKYTTLELATEKDLAQIFYDLVSINQSLTPEDLRVVKWFVETDTPRNMPSVIPFKENLCTLAAMGVPGLPIKTPTDVLRIAVHMSGGDISLPKVPHKTKKERISFFRGTTEVPNPERENFKFKKFSRSERKLLLGFLENTNCSTDDMMPKRERWIKLAQVLHVGDYAGRYPKAYEAIRQVRQDRPQSWYGRLTAAFKTSLEHGLEILKAKPGEFMRRMDWLIRSYPDNIKTIMSYFNIAAKGSSNKVLYEVYSHFENRAKNITDRKIKVKGARKPTTLPDLPALPEKAIQSVQSGVLYALKEKFSLLEPLGKVYIDPELNKIPIPTNMRSLDFSLKPRIPGQRIPWDNPDSKVIRAFYHWHDKDGCLDPDLSVTFAKEDGEMDFVNYYNLRGKKSIAVHSGDIIARKGYNAEYVDINIKEALEAGYRYACIDVRSYRGGGLAQMEGKFGIMEREKPESNDLWLPETLVNCHSTESTANNTLLGIIDLETKEYIFLDVDSDGLTSAHEDLSNTLDIINYYSKLPKFSVYHLLVLHADSRGEEVLTPEEADIKFMYDDFASSYQKVGSYMGV